jgi:hypothetical protein
MSVVSEFLEHWKDSVRVLRLISEIANQYPTSSLVLHVELVAPRVLMYRIQGQDAAKVVFCFNSPEKRSRFVAWNKSRRLLAHNTTTNDYIRASVRKHWCCKLSRQLQFALLGRGASDSICHIVPIISWSIRLKRTINRTRCKYMRREDRPVRKEGTMRRFEIRCLIYLTESASSFNWLVL